MDMAETNRGFFIHLQDKKAVVTEQEIPMPVVGPDDVLVAVSGASVNPVDLKRAASGDQQVMGFDTVGRVVRTGANVSGFSAGQKSSSPVRASARAALPGIRASLAS